MSANPALFPGRSGCPESWAPRVVPIDGQGDDEVQQPDHPESEPGRRSTLPTGTARAPVTWVALEGEVRSRDVGRRLQAADFDVHVLPPGREGVGILAQGLFSRLPAPDLVILDGYFGDCSAVELNAVLRGLCWRSRIVICLAAGADPTVFAGAGFRVLEDAPDPARIVEAVTHLWNGSPR